VQGAFSAADSAVWKVFPRPADTPPTVTYWFLWSSGYSTNMRWAQLCHHQTVDCRHWSHVWEQARLLRCRKYFVLFTGHVVLLGDFTFDLAFTEPIRTAKVWYKYITV